MRNKTKIILIASITLNVILIGFHLGHGFGAFHHKPNSPFEHEEKKIISILPQDKQEPARQLFSKIRDLHQNNFAQMRDQMKKVEEQAVAENFNEQDFLSEFAKSDTMMLQMRQQTNAEIAKFLTTLTQKDRQKLVDEIKKDHHFFGKKPREFDDKPDHKPDHEPSADKAPTYKSNNDD